MYKVGIIGFGKMGMLHGALLAGSRQATIAAICDKSAVMRLGFKHVYKNVHAYSDAKKMFEKERLDAVLVTTPTFNHKESVQLAVENKCAVFVEKPLAINAEQAQYICEMADAKNAVIQIGFCNRFLPSVLKAGELLEDKRIGKIEHVEAQMFIGDVFEEHTGWRYKPELSGGGALIDFGIHMLDLLIHFFGEIETVNAETKQLYSRLVEDEASVEILFKSGVVCDFETSWSKKEFRKSYTKMEIQGDAGRIVLTDQTLELFDMDGEKLEEYTYPDLYPGCFMDLGGLLLSYQMDSFLKNISGKKLEKRMQGCTPYEALYVQRVIESIYRSAEIKDAVGVNKND